MDETERWYISDFVVAANWNQTAWDADYLLAPPGEVVLTFDGTDTDGKDFTGAELQSQDFYSYGSYEVEMTASNVSGVVSSFFLFSNTFFGAARHNEIDFEFLGNDTTKVNINYYYGDQKLGDNGSVQVELGFDAAAGMHSYRIEWHPDGIRWYADGSLLYEVTGETAPLPVPDEPMKIYMNIWTGGSGLETWHGPVAADAEAQASYTSVTYTPYVPEAPTDAGGAISFAGEAQAYAINLAEGSFARAARVMALGDSLTVGHVDANDPNEVPEERDGYRQDLFDHITVGGGWIDYVGDRQNGPAGMLDPDHAAVSGEALRNMVKNNDSSLADISVNLAAHTPDIMLLMAGTNDYNANNFFSNRFPSLMTNMQAAIDQFYTYAGNAQKYLVISTLAPKTLSGIPEEYAYFINEGYSIVDGIEVVGDAGNGTYVPGLRALVASQQGQHPTLLLFDNPVGVDGLSSDQIHFTEQSYAEYASSIYDLLLAQIGQQGGSFGTLAGTLPAATDVTGGNAGDRITGDAADNVITGGGGADYLTGGSGGDTFVYGTAALDGKRDYVADLSIAEGDSLDLTGIIAHYGWTAAEFEAAVRFTEDAMGTELSIDGPDGLLPLAYFHNVSAADLAGLLNVDPGGGPGPDPDPDPDPEGQLIGTEGRDTLTDTIADTEILGLGERDTLIGNGGNDTLDGGGGRDNLYGGSGADVFRFAVDTLDGNRDEVRDFSIAEGDKVDLSPIAEYFGWSEEDLLDALAFKSISAGVRISITTPDGSYNMAAIHGVGMQEFLAADTLILQAGPPPDTGDDDGNLALAAPDIDIDASEAGAVQIILSGLDADATAVVTVSGGGTDLTQNAAADGTLIFDLTSLPDGPVTTSVTATDGNGNSSTAAGPALTLDTAPDVSADEDGNLAVSAPDTDITASEAGSVTFSVFGLDADATAVVTVSDGTTSVSSAPIASDSSILLDLTSLQDGPLSLSVTATDSTGNTASVAGPGLILDSTVVELPVLSGTSQNDTLTDGDGDTEILGLAGRDNLYGNGGSDILDGGAGRDNLYGGSDADVFRFAFETLDGYRDDVRDFSIAEGDKVDLSLIAQHYGWNAAETEAALQFKDLSAGLRITIGTPDGGFNLALLHGVTEAEFLTGDTLLF
ncbi:family 16 glycosylhydrolase [Leisingera sp. XS_AS12]